AAPDDWGMHISVQGRIVLQAIPLCRVSTGSRSTSAASRIPIFALSGHLVGSVDPSDAFFDHATEQMADLVRLHRATGNSEVLDRNLV
ncbi:MAG: hypothetical protein ACREX8_14930, partial [Gammaproteobacteria bacterium]